MEKVLIKRIYDLVMIVSSISAGDFCNKWVQDLDFENNLDTSQLLWDKDGISCRITCGILCNSNPSCRSFFYHPSLQKCMGSQSYKRGLPSGQSVQQGWEYYTKSQQCDGGYTFNKTLGLCFKIHPETKTYQKAMDACEAEGAKLIIIRNEMEYLLISGAVKAAGSSLFLPFIGLRKTLSNGKLIWKWWNGQEASYLKWSTGEPNDQNGTEDCVIINRSEYRYNDVGCWNHLSFICHKQI